MATTGTFKYTALNSGNNQIVGNGGYTKYSVSLSGEYPTQPYTITGASFRYTFRNNTGRPWTSFFLCRNDTSTETLGTCNAAGNTGVEIYNAISTGANYENITSIILKGDGGSSGSILSGTYLTITVDWKLNQTAVTAPTAISCSPSPFDASAKLSWSGAKAGVSNAIKGYELIYYTSTNGGTSWSAGTTVKTTAATYTINTASLPSAAKLKCKVRTMGTITTLNSGYYASTEWSKITITTPTAPTAGTASPTPLFENSITFSWSGQKAGTNNAITGYTLYYSLFNGSTWGAETAVSTTAATYTMDTTNVARGYLVRFRVITKGARSNSAYSTYFGSWRKNRVPPTPTIVYPVGGATTYSRKPKFKITTGTEPDGQKQTITVQSGSYSCNASNLGNNEAKTIAFSSSLPIGAYTMSVSSSDGLASGSAVSRTLTIATPNWTDASLANVAVKAKHINELRTAINNVRQYFGLAAYTWTDTIAKGTMVKAIHFNEMITALEEAASVAGVSLNLTNVKAGERIKGAIITSLRSAIEQL